MEENPRYSRLTEMLDLLIYMQSRVQGVTLNEIMERCSVSRRTAERMRDSLMLSVPQIEEMENPHSREKRWGFPPHQYMTEVVNFTPEEIANLEKLKKYQEENGSEDKAKMIDRTICNIRTLNRRKLPQLENTIEMLMQTEGFAVKQTPKYKFDLNMLSTIREAMKTKKKITAKYIDRDKVLAPYGLIYGEKVYLIGVEEDKGTAPYCYLLHRFSEVKLSKESFDKGDFDLEAFSKKSFGVYQGECIDVKLLFSADVAEDVLHYQFHSTQKVKQNEDGTVSVKFKASGEYEIMWHLFKWGAGVKILSPSSLRKQYVELLQNTLDKQKEK